jgi:hypothetical protein
VSHVKYELGFYITEDDILHSDRCESLRSNDRQMAVTSRSKQTPLPLVRKRTKLTERPPLVDEI